MRLSRILCFQTLIICAHCGDLTRECADWVKDIGCHRKPELLWLACPQACTASARDLHPDCEDWAQKGECMSNPVLMHLECPQACGLQV
ncbi:hypothetical protein EON63_21150 [archaeon]|nr:MAG: hypothetical protein EON63_21150 [archaeon]